LRRSIGLCLVCSSHGINAKGGLLGRHIELLVEDSATTDSVAEAKATKLVEQDKSM
jgi:ABC-type branched-subunit amino acid transport system substrate-binding protein